MFKADHPETIHPEDDVLEQYAMAKLPEPAAESLEEHILVCASCQDRLDSTENYIRSMKAVMLRAEVKKANRKRLRATVALPKAAPVWRTASAAFLLCVGIFVGTHYLGQSSTPVAIILSATRGETPSAAAGGRLDLTLDARDLKPGADYHAQIVNGDGAGVWEQASASVQGGFAHLSVKKRLAPGQYFVRLNAPGGQTAREYALQLK